MYPFHGTSSHNSLNTQRRNLKQRKNHDQHLNLPPHLPMNQQSPSQDLQLVSDAACQNSKNNVSDLGKLV